MRFHSDYHGWTNWDTWETAMWLSSDLSIWSEIYHIISDAWTRDEAISLLKDWTVAKVIGPRNAKALQEAKEWNEIPYEERVDEAFEMIKGFHPGLAELLSNFGLGPDVSDVEPFLIDPEIVNWDEILGHIVEGDSNLSHLSDDSEEGDPDAPGSLTLPDEWFKEE